DCHQRTRCPTHHALAVAPAQSIQETVAAIGGHHDQIRGHVAGHLYNGVNDIARPHDTVPLPARHGGTVHCWGVPRGTDEQRCEGPCGALQALHQAHRRHNGGWGTWYRGDRDQDVL